MRIGAQFPNATVRVRCQTRQTRGCLFDVLPMLMMMEFALVRQVISTDDDSELFKRFVRRTLEENLNNVVPGLSDMPSVVRNMYESPEFLRYQVSQPCVESCLPSHACTHMRVCSYQLASTNMRVCSYQPASADMWVCSYQLAAPVDSLLRRGVDFQVLPLIAYPHTQLCTDLANADRSSRVSWQATWY